MTNNTDTDATLHPRTEDTDVLDPGILARQSLHRATAALDAAPESAWHEGGAGSRARVRDLLGALGTLVTEGTTLVGDPAALAHALTRYALGVVRDELVPGTPLVRAMTDLVRQARDRWDTEA